MNAERGASERGPSDFGPMTEQFLQRPWAKWLAILFFGPLGLAGLVGAVAIVAGIFLLPDVPLQLGLPLAGLGFVLAGRR